MSATHLPSLTTNPHMQAELDLLTMDDAQSGSNERGFDVMDPRFGALYESPMFAPDPAHPRYK